LLSSPSKEIGSPDPEDKKENMMMKKVEDGVKNQADKMRETLSSFKVPAPKEIEEKGAMP
jgi:hypothetical protein